MIDADERDMSKDLTETKEMSDEGKRLDKIRIYRYRDILMALQNLGEALNKEDPPPLFEKVSTEGIKMTHATTLLKRILNYLLKIKKDNKQDLIKEIEIYLKGE